MKKLFSIAIGILLGLTMFGCATTTETTTTGLNYEMFFSIDDYNQVFNRSQGTYIVYMYQTTCVHCENIKDIVLGFADTHPEVMMYFFNIANATEELQAAFLNTVGLTKSSFGTPTLVVVVDNSFDKTARSNFLFAGEVPITNILRDIDLGSYEYLK